MIFCIDSHVFIWAIKKQADEHDKDKKEDADEFLKWIDEGEHTLLVPTVVLAECLSQEPIEKQAAIMKVTYETCAVVNFDATAALKYAQVLNLDKFQHAKQKARAAGIAREQMKIDYLIVCCAMANGAQRIYSHDPDIYKFGEGLIDVQPIPERTRKSQQQSLFNPELIAQILAGNETVQERGLLVSVEEVQNDGSLLEETQNTSGNNKEKEEPPTQTNDNEIESAPINELNNEQSKKESNPEKEGGELPTETGD